MASTQNPRPQSAPDRPPALTLPDGPAQDLSSAPLIQDRNNTGYASSTPLSSAFRFIEPTWRNYIQYVDAESRSGSEGATRYLAIWQSLPRDERVRHWPEQLCVLANVKPSDLISWVSRQVWEEQSASASMCMSFMRPRVLGKVAGFAMESADNYKHAELFMKSSGMLPSAGRGGGSPITIFNSPVASSGSVAGVRSESSPVHASGLRDMDSEIVELSRIMQTDNDDGRKCSAQTSNREDDAEDDDDEVEDDRD